MIRQHHGPISGILGLFASAMLAGLSSAQSNTNYSSRLICDQASYDFGEMDNRKTVEHTFTVRNSGDGPIEITKIFSGCSCARRFPRHIGLVQQPVRCVEIEKRKIVSFRLWGLRLLMLESSMS